MRADDAFRNELREAIRGLEALAEEAAAVADVDLHQADDHVRLSLAPREPAACPVELIIHADQRFDLAVGGETYEGLAADGLHRLEVLLRAVMAGRIVTRHLSTRATDAPVAVETIIDTDAGPWRQERLILPMARIATPDDCLVRDRHFAPYKA